MNFTITDAAAKHIVKHPGFLRVRIKSGGCSGFKTLFTFEESKNKGDVVLHHLEACVIIDPLSFSFIQNATLDYRDEMIASQFILTNPNASSQCGCGESFAIS
jgi:iron-sulfur cluster insertion protein